MRLSIGRAYDIDGLTGFIVRSKIRTRLWESFIEAPGNRSVVMTSMVALFGTFFVGIVLLLMVFHPTFQFLRDALIPPNLSTLFGLGMFGLAMGIYVFFLAALVYMASVFMVDGMTMTRRFEKYVLERAWDPVNLGER
jgi:hypothetical protein